jgi:trans-AT polyketide synthase/acyltransferase/oxidoreductase domain-containing protein
MQPIGTWTQNSVAPIFNALEMKTAIESVRDPLHIVRRGPGGLLGIALGGTISTVAQAHGESYEWMGTVPRIYPEWLGDRTFLSAHGVRFPYIVGEMATGIATAEMVVAAAQAGMLGFFGSAGLGLEVTDKAITEIESRLPDGTPWGANLIHSPAEPEMEMAIVELFLRRGVRRVSASAFMGITSAVVRYALSGIRLDADTGAVQRTNHVFAKISRVEVARPFLMPAPQPILDALVAQGYLTHDEAQLGQHIPIAEDITAEADSGGHTDNRPLTVLLPTILALRDEICASQGYSSPVRVGASGGLGVPSAVAAAFALGAAFVMTGSVNQSALEAGTSPDVKRVLAQTGMADVMMAPAADMFELGVKVQVLKRGTLFGARAQMLYDIYIKHDDLEALPPKLRVSLEKDIFRESLDQTWQRTRQYWMNRNPDEVARAEREPKHRMALCFRAYLGEASRWARFGDPERKLDYQIWCGPAMGAFNAWVKGSYLEAPENRTVAQIGFNLLEGAAVVTRVQQLRTHAVALVPETFDFRPRPLA